MSVLSQRLILRLLEIKRKFLLTHFYFGLSYLLPCEKGIYDPLQVFSAPDHEQLKFLLVVSVSPWNVVNKLLFGSGWYLDKHDILDDLKREPFRANQVNVLFDV